MAPCSCFHFCFKSVQISPPQFNNQFVECIILSTYNYRERQTDLRAEKRADGHCKLLPPWRGHITASVRNPGRAGEHGGQGGVVIVRQTKVRPRVRQEHSLQTGRRATAPAQSKNCDATNDDIAKKGVRIESFK